MVGLSRQIRTVEDGTYCTMKTQIECVQEADKQFCRRSANVFIELHSGDYYISRRENEVISTVLGSCIAACIRDTKLNIGGMNHFLLPSPRDGKEFCTRYGANAMEQLMNEIIKMGGNKKNFELKLFGGAKMYESTMNIGLKNITFINEYVQNEGLNVVSRDLGGEGSRRLLYHAPSGRARLKFIPIDKVKEIVKDEEALQKSINKEAPKGGDIELF